MKILVDADARIRSDLSEDERLEATSIGRGADLRQLLEVALLEAEAAVAVGGTHEAGDHVKRAQ